MILKERFSTFFAAHIPNLMAGLDILATQAPVFAREGHNKALSSGLAPDKRIGMLRALRWRVLPCPGSGFVLPDCVALGADDESGLKPLIAADLSKITTVLMPLSTDRMLLGIHPAATVPELIDFNDAAAAASHTFFIAARSDDELKALSESIGKYSEQLVDETIRSVFDEFLTTRGVPPLTAGNERNAVDTGNVNREAEDQERPPSKAPKYSVHFHSCADRATADKIVATLNVITENLVQMMPLDRLDGITFSSDYPAALRDLDRGFQASAPLKATAEEYGVGVAMAPLVMRDGILKTHIVMRGEIGHSLISEDESSWRLALHTIAGQLAYAACDQILDESLPGVLLKRIDDRYDGFLYAAIHSAWTGYFSCRASASFYPEAGLSQQELLVAVLKRAQNDIPAARLAYRFHGQIDRMLEVVMPRIADILGFSGTVLGHYDGLEQSFLDDRALAAALKEFGLNDWIVLFDSELSQLWDRREKWASFDEFLMLNRHVERLLWQYGLFPWKADDGQIQITVPLATDAGKLVGLQPRVRRIAAAISRGLKCFLSRVAGPAINPTSAIRRSPQDLATHTKRFLKKTRAR